MTKNFRKCIACGAIKPKEEMIKITKEHFSQTLIINPNTVTFGRSAYLCYNQSCVDIAIKKKKINKALKTNADADLKGILDGQFKS